jgi:hypothetical protein
MLGVFAEFERTIIAERVRAGPAQAEAPCVSSCRAYFFAYPCAGWPQSFRVEVGDDVRLGCRLWQRKHQSGLGLRYSAWSASR